MKSMRWRQATPGSALDLRFQIKQPTCRPWWVAGKKATSRQDASQGGGAERNNRELDVPLAPVQIKILFLEHQAGVPVQTLHRPRLINGDDPKEYHARATQIRHKVEGRKARASDEKQVGHVGARLSGQADRVQGRSGDTAAEGLQEELNAFRKHGLQPCAWLRSGCISIVDRMN